MKLSNGNNGQSVIAIGSGKGGVGKTWLAVTLAQSLAEAGQRTLLFDGDLGLANVDIQLGLTPAHDLAGVIAGRARLADAALHHAGTRRHRRRTRRRAWIGR